MIIYNIFYKHTTSMPNLFINPLNTTIMEVTVMSAAAPVQKQQGVEPGSHKQGSKNDRRKAAGVSWLQSPACSKREKSHKDFIAPIGVNLRNEDRHPVITFGQRNRYR